MRAKEFINEVFDSDVPGHLVRATPDLYTTKAIIGGRTIIFNSAQYDDDEGNSVWAIDFVEYVKDGTGTTFGKTGSGNELRVFSFVIESIKDLISRYHPDQLTFTSHRADENRTNLYKRMLKRVKVPGYHAAPIESSEYDDYFKIVKDNVDESYQPPELNVGDKILKGKFKNSPAEIKGFTKDKHNQPVLKTNKGNIQLFKPRITKLMKEGQVLLERATDILYHKTSIHSAAKILKDGEFHLSSTAGNRSEEQYAPKGYPYFLSTSRSKRGDYARYVGNGAVMFVLDGQWLSDRYPVKPIDYWERAWQHSPDRTSETEDRVFSRKNTIALGCVTEMHILLKEQEGNQSEMVRQMMITAKGQGIKTYFYTDEKDWAVQNKRKTAPISNNPVLKGYRETPRYFQRPARGVKGYGRSSLLDWMELIMKRRDQELSKTADKLKDNLQWYGDQSQMFAVDLSNAKKPDSNEYPLAVKINDYMIKRGLSVAQLVDAVKDKWKYQPR